MKKSKFPISLLLSFAFFALLSFLGIDPAGIVGLVVIVFFGLGSFVAGMLSIFKFGYEKNPFVLIVSVLFIFTSPLTVWFGYILFASNVYLPFLSDPAKVIYNPTSSLALPLMLVLAGLTGIFIVFVDKTKKKSDKKFKLILTLSCILVIFLGGYGVYVDLHSSEITNNASVVYKSINFGRRSKSYRVVFNIDGVEKEFEVSKQIYGIFDIEDNVSITYKPNSLKTITLTK